MKTLKLIIMGAIVLGICLPAVSQAGVQPYLNSHDTVIQAGIGAGHILPAAELDRYLAASGKTDGPGLGNDGVDNLSGNNGTGNNGNGLGLGNGGVGNNNGNGNGKPKPSKNK